MMLLLAVVGAKADVIPSSYYSAVGEGEFYLYNVTQEKFLCGTGDPSLVTTPTNVVILAALTDDDAGKYSILAKGGKYLKMGYWNNRYLWGNNWTDNGFFKWTFTGTTTYKLSITATADADDKFTNGNTYYTNGEGGMSETSAGANDWALITEAAYTTYLTTLDPAVINKTTITEAKGDATSLITNPTFEDVDVSAWSGGRRVGCNTWRGSGNDYENTDGNDATFSQTLSNMPAGTYKVVAAVRGAVGTTATASINGTSGTTITNTEFQDNVQINLNGVLMPKSRNDGFNTAQYALGWKWATATYTLTTNGDLTICFAMNGSGFRGIDDVHLYYMSDGTNTYAMEYTDGINNNDHVVTCDLSTDNPNKIFTATSNIFTASGAIANNLRVSNGFINNLVIYDGYEVSIPANTRAVASTLYRNISAGAFATICCPFQITGGTGVDGTFYQPASLTSGTLNFESVDTKVVGKAYLYKATSAVSTFTGPKDGALATSPVDNGTGVVMKGTYTNIAAVPTDDYVLSGTNLYKVTSDVSLKPFRAYFTIPGAGVRLNIAFDDEETTAINSIANSQEQNANSYYNLQGQRVENPKKGLYIVNGKKIVKR